jgi:hypothetical protein
MAKSPDDRYLSAGDLGRAALTAAAGASLSRAERSVATGPAAPSAVEAVPASAMAPSPPATATVVSPGRPQNSAPEAPERSWLRPPGRLGRRTIIGGAIAVCAIAVAAVALIAGGGSSAPSPSTTSPGSLGAVQGQTVQAIPNEVVKQTKQLTTKQGYAYRLVLSTVKPSAGASSSTSVPYYFTLWARHGNDPFVTVQRLKLPWAFTTSSTVAQLQVDPNPDGSINGGFSWFVKRGDTTDQTHYFTLTPQGIAITS